MKITNTLEFQFNEVIYGEGIDSGIGIGRMVTGAISVPDDKDIVLQKKHSNPLIMVPQKVGASYEAFELTTTDVQLENAADTLIVHMRGASNREDLAGFIQKVNSAIEVCGSPTLKLTHIKVASHYDLESQ